ncbi:MAG: MFS transporter [Anaerolineales bacterium]
MLVSFRVPAYRWVWASTFFVFTNRITTILAQGWLVLQLTDSALWVGIAAGVQGAGQFTFSVFSGVLLDRLDRRRVALCADFLAAAVALALAALVVTERVALWHVLVAAFSQGLYFAFRWPATSMIVFAVVGPRHLLNASAAQMLALNVARVFGSAMVGALMAAWGVGAGYAFAATCLLGAGALMFAVRGSFTSNSTQEPFGHALREGVRYARASKPIFHLLVLSATVEMFGYSHLVLLPIIARDVLAVGEVGLGFISAAAGAGALISTLIVGSLGDFRNKGALLVSSTLFGGLFLALFAFSPWYVLSLVLIAIAGGALMTYDVTLQTLLLMLSSDTMRGRVQGLFAFTVGSNSLGGLLLGGLAALAGAPLALAMGGGIIIATTLRMLPTLGRMHPTVEEAVVATN